MLHIVVLASGRGSNFSAIQKNCEEGHINGKITLLLSDKPEAGALDAAAQNGIPAKSVLPANFERWSDYEEALLKEIADVPCDVVVLAGYMRLLGQTILDKIGVPVLNIHPSLLPAFSGLHAQRQALEYGVKVTGCTVHFVDLSLDGGPIIAQRTVPVEDDDTEDSLSARILVQEHELYSQVLQWLSEGRLQIQGRKVVVQSR